jgi:hypothetical protein
LDILIANKNYKKNDSRSKEERGKGEGSWKNIKVREGGLTAATTGGWGVWGDKKQLSWCFSLSLSL